MLIINSYEILLSFSCGHVRYSRFSDSHRRWNCHHDAWLRCRLIYLQALVQEWRVLEQQRNFRKFAGQCYRRYDGFADNFPYGPCRRDDDRSAVVSGEHKLGSWLWPIRVLLLGRVHIEWWDLIRRSWRRNSKLSLGWRYLQWRRKHRWRMDADGWTRHYWVQGPLRDEPTQSCWNVYVRWFWGHLC